jgi:hypothetical protein
MSTNTPNAEFKNTRNGKKSLGLQNRGIEKIECADCGALLMVFQITKSNKDLNDESSSSVITKVVVDCGLCGGLSYVKTINGQFYPGAANDNMLFEPLDAKDARVSCDIRFRAWEKK